MDEVESNRDNNPHNELDVIIDQDVTINEANRVSCPSVGYSLVILTILTVIFYFVSRSEDSNLVANIDAGFNLGLLTLSVFIGFRLIKDKSESSISGTIAQRFKPMSYLAVCLIVALSINTSSLVSNASLSIANDLVNTNQINNTETFIITDNKIDDMRIGFVLCYVGSILSGLITIFPLMVLLSVDSTGILSSLKGSIRMRVNTRDLQVILHTDNSQLSSVLHYIFIGLGYFAMLAGCVILLIHGVDDPIKSISSTLIGLSLLFGLTFLLAGPICQDELDNSTSILLEFESLIFMFASVSLINLNISNLI
jgi:hypothetical protein